MDRKSFSVASDRRMNKDDVTSLVDLTEGLNMDDEDWGTVGEGSEERNLSGGRGGREGGGS